VDTPNQSTHAGVATADGSAFERAYLDFMRSLHALASGGNLTDQLAQSYADYQRIVQAGVVNEQTQRAAAEAYARHIELLQRALSVDQTRQGAADAFQRYLQDVKSAWAGVDGRTMPPAMLAAIGQSMTAVAMTTASVIGAIGAAPGVSPTTSPR
jgi:hypothetical protein